MGRAIKRMRSTLISLIQETRTHMPKDETGKLLVDFIIEQDGELRLIFDSSLTPEQRQEIVFPE